MENSGNIFPISIDTSFWFEQEGDLKSLFPSFKKVGNPFFLNQVYFKGRLEKQLKDPDLIYPDLILIFLDPEFQEQQIVFLSFNVAIELKKKQIELIKIGSKDIKKVFLDYLISEEKLPEDFFFLRKALIHILTKYTVRESFTIRDMLNYMIERILDLGDQFIQTFPVRFRTNNKRLLWDKADYSEISHLENSLVLDYSPENDKSQDQEDDKNQEDEIAPLAEPENSEIDEETEICDVLNIQIPEEDKQEFGCLEDDFGSIDKELEKLEQDGFFEQKLEDELTMDIDEYQEYRERFEMIVKDIISILQEFENE